jgi:hypothetical protein
MAIFSNVVIVVCGSDIVIFLHFALFFLYIYYTSLSCELNMYNIHTILKVM